ncbi:MAG: BPSS1780 family membrane protein [Saprospiraceae bacterium]
MSLEQYPKLQEINETNYQFKFGDYIGQGFDLFKQNMGNFVGYTLVYVMIIGVLSVIPLIGFLGVYALSPILYAGFLIGAHRTASGQRLEFGDFFKGFDHAGQLIVWYLVSIIATTLLMLPFFISIFSWYSEMLADPEGYIENPDPFGMFANIPSWSYLLFLPAIYLGVAWRWAPQFIVFNNMNFWDAMEMSRRLITKKWLIQFLFLIVFSIIGGIGALGLLIGMFFTVPAAMCMEYAAFADVTKLNQVASSVDDIEAHLVE